MSHRFLEGDDIWEHKWICLLQYAILSTYMVLIILYAHDFQNKRYMSNIAFTIYTNLHCVAWVVISMLDIVFKNL